MLLFFNSSLYARLVQLKVEQPNVDHGACGICGIAASEVFCELCFGKKKQPYVLQGKVSCNERGQQQARKK